MASGNETAAASSSMGEGTRGSQKAAEGVTVVVPPPPSSPLPVPQLAPIENRDEDNDSPPPLENEPDAMEGDAPPPLPIEPEPEPEPLPIEPEGGDVVAAGEIAPAGEAAGDFACEICSARYLTEKAMFGHLRSHKDRGWRGAFRPPTFSMEEFGEYQEHLVKPEEEQLREIEAEERAAAGERVVLDVDLNAQVEEFILPDLNLPPPDED
nr:protein VASP homolog [Ipomoea batatas]